MAISSLEGFLSDKKQTYNFSSLTSTDSLKQANQKNATLEETFCTGSLDVLNKRSGAYYATQSMLQIAEKRYCLLAISTDVDNKINRVEVEDNFSKKNIRIY